MTYNWHLYVIWDYRWVFLRGAWITAQLTFFALLLGVFVGLPLGLMRGSKYAALRGIATPIVEFFRSTPSLVQLFWIYYALPILIGVRLEAMVAVVLGLGFHTAAYIAEIFRAGIASIDRGQFLAAKSIGMSYAQAMRRIILPQAIRRMVPPFINELANLIKLTTLASVLAVYELLHEANDLISQTFRPFEIYTALALAFVVIIYPMIWFSRRLELFWTRRA
jgi:polar amino acid transport system permease protein